MRRRRHLLQVTTFPFVAVLLCAMGSLLLLLLIIDRRARLVARAKALDLVARQEAAVKRRQEEEQAQRDYERREAHERLAQAYRELQGSLAEARAREKVLRFDLECLENHTGGLQAQLRLTRANLGAAEQTLAERRAETGMSAKLAEQIRRELAAQQAEIEQLEMALDQLRMQRQRHQHVYSVIPYRGQRGADRPPVYIECTSSGLVFHPDRPSSPVAPSSAEIRTEVERRLAAAAKQAPGGNAAPYVYFLVRPDGIASYYQAQAALDGLKVDFGYELVERDWILDFHDTERTAQQPAFAAANPQPAGTSVAGAPPSDRAELRAPGLGSDKPGGNANLGPVLGGPSGNSSPLPPAWTAAKPPPRAADPLQAPTVGPAPPAAKGVKILPPKGANEPLANEPVAHGLMAGKPMAKEPTAREPGGPALLRSPDAAPPAPPPLSRIIGSRDWVILVECTHDAVVLPSTGQRFAAASLLAKQQPEHTIVAAVRTLIQKRQATVRPGEPPYRPLLRFRVHPQGLGVYYLAYPLLERLQLPMSRENLDHDS